MTLSPARGAISTRRRRSVVVPFSSVSTAWCSCTSRCSTEARASRPAQAATAASTTPATGMPACRAMPSASPTWCRRIEPGTANTASSPGRGDLLPQRHEVRVREVRVRDLRFGGARERIHREVRPEAIARDHRLQARAGRGGLADHEARGIDERDARARRQAHAVAHRGDGRIDEFDADHRHRSFLTAPAGSAAGGCRGRSPRRAPGAPARAAGRAAGTSAPATAAARPASS